MRLRSLDRVTWVLSALSSTAELATAGLFRRVGSTHDTMTLELWPRVPFDGSDPAFPQRAAGPRTDVDVGPTHSRRKCASLPPRLTQHKWIFSLARGNFVIALCKLSISREITLVIFFRCYAQNHNSCDFIACMCDKCT